MDKTISVFLILSCIMLSFVASSEYSGIKFGIDTDLFKIVQKMNLNKFAQNKSLIPAEGVEISSSSFPSYNLKVANMNITNVSNPKSETVKTRIDPTTDTKYLEISISGMEIDLVTDFDIKVISLFSEQGRKTAIKVILDSIEGEFYFNSGSVHFTKFQVKIGQIDLKFNSVWFKIIYYLAKGLIIKGINNEVSSLHDALEKSLNNFISSQFLIDIGVGIGCNATNVDRPELDIFERTRMQTKSNIEKVNLKFLETEANLADDSIKSTILTFGIHGSLYPNLSPQLQADVPPAAEMKYQQSLFNNKISFLVSDYSVNTLLFMVQQTGALKKVFTNTTNQILPFNIDTQGMSLIVPELIQKYNETKLMEFKIYVSPFGYKQPEINSDLDGAKLSFNFALEFNVFETDDPFDDAVTQLKADIKAHLKFQFLISDNKLSIVVFKIVVDQIIVKSDNLNVNVENFKNNLENTLNELEEKFKPLLTNVDVAGLLKNTFGLEFNNLIVNTKTNHLVVSIDIEDL